MSEPQQPQWRQDADGLWRFGNDQTPFTAPPRPDGQGGWTTPVRAAAPQGAPTMPMPVMAPTPPAVAVKKRSPWPVLAAGAGGLILGAIIGGAGNEASDDVATLRSRNEALERQLADAKAAPPPAAPTAPAPATTTAPRPTAVRTTKPPPPPKPATFARFAASTSQRTKAFTVPDGVEWEVCYTMRGSGNNAIFLESPPGEPTELLVNEIGPVNGCTQQYSGGRFSLDVTASGGWTVTVREQN